MEATLHRAETRGKDKGKGGGLTSREAQLLRAMITRSDNSAASTLWSDLGRSRLHAFLREAGTQDTTLGPGRLWGLTRTSARDQTRLLGLLTNAKSFLKNRSHALTLLGRVQRGQRWTLPR
ncbi:serine hydrolase, partial [Streptomyces daliensis]|nr:serine hydrolase [Streptomyces daliensis]